MAGERRTPRLTVAELEAENRALKRHGVATSITKILQSLIQWGMLGFICWLARDVGIAWAGQVTKADITLSATAQANFELINKTAERICGELHGVQQVGVTATVLAILVAVGAIIYGRRQARLRRDVIQRLSPFEQMFEKGIDPKRSSSGIQPTGDTRPEDQ